MSAEYIDEIVTKLNETSVAEFKKNYANLFEEFNNAFKKLDKVRKPHYQQAKNYIDNLDTSKQPTNGEINQLRTFLNSAVNEVRHIELRTPELTEEEKKAYIVKLEREITQRATKHQSWLQRNLDYFIKTLQEQFPQSTARAAKLKQTVGNWLNNINTDNLRAVLKCITPTVKGRAAGLGYTVGALVGLLQVIKSVVGLEREPKFKYTEESKANALEEEENQKDSPIERGKKTMISRARKGFNEGFEKGKDYVKSKFDKNYKKS